MDTLRGSFEELDEPEDLDFDDEDHAGEAPPVAIGQDERRMQVRAYNHWASLLGDRSLPSVEDLEPDQLPDFAPNSVLLDFSSGIENPAIAYLGRNLAEECAIGDTTIRTLADIPGRSLLSRITDHYMQILANKAPIGFEAEFTHQRGSTIQYRGILLPFSNDDDTIDFIYGVINWRELADQDTAGELLLEFDQMVEAKPATAPSGAGLTDWADGPGTEGGRHGFSADDSLPRPQFGFDHIMLPDFGEPQEQAPDRPADLPAPAQPDEMALVDWLASAQQMASAARGSEERTRSALYDALGRAYDFALAAAQQPQDFAELLKDTGLKAQDRAPMTPVVKLVFGTDYDKTRLTEYAAALSYAMRRNVPQGELAQVLRDAEGGLKGVVQAERAWRREQAGKPARRADTPPPRLARKLRALEPQPLEALPDTGREFALVMVRRNEDGALVVLGEVPDDGRLVQRAAKRLTD